MKILIILILSCLFGGCQTKEAVFTLVECGTEGYDNARENGREYDYSYFILIENIPKDKIKLKRLMISHFLEITAAMDSMQTSLNLNFVSCKFFKSTYATRERFKERWGVTSFVSANGWIPYNNTRRRGETYTSPYGRNARNWSNNETYIGDIYIGRCKTNKTKLESGIEVNLGTGNDDNFIQCNGPCPEDAEIDILLYECEESDHRTYSKDFIQRVTKYYEEENELVKLFSEYYKR